MTEKYKVSVRKGQIQLGEKAMEAFATISAIDATIKELKAQKEAIEKPLKEAMKKHNVDRFECDLFTATRVAETTTETVNVLKMKDDGIYDKYKMEVPKAGYVRLTYKKGKKNGKEDS
jgi:predicted phage-related endonuclease